MQCLHSWLLVGAALCEQTVCSLLARISEQALTRAAACGNCAACRSCYSAVKSAPVCKRYRPGIEAGARAALLLPTATLWQLAKSLQLSSAACQH